MKKKTCPYLLLVVSTLFLVVASLSSTSLGAEAASTGDDGDSRTKRNGGTNATTIIQFRPGSDWGPTYIPHKLFQWSIWAGFFAMVIPDNGLIDFVTGRFRHKSRRYLELSGGVVAASLVGRADMMMKIALLQVAGASVMPSPGGTLAPSPTTTLLDSSNSAASSSLSSESAISAIINSTVTTTLPFISGSTPTPAPTVSNIVSLTPNYLFFITQAPIVYGMLKVGGVLIDSYYTAVMISATSIYSNVGVLLVLLLGQLFIKFLVTNLLGKDFHTSMASAYLHCLSIFNIPMAMHAAFYFTQEELLTFEQKPGAHTVVVGIMTSLFVMVFLGTLASNGIPSPVATSRRVLSWWASDVSPTKSERLHWAWLTSMWLFSAVAGIIGGNWIGAIFDGRPRSEQTLFAYGSVALYFLSAICNCVAIFLIPESRKLSITAVLSDVVLFIFCFPQIDPNIVGAMSATVLVIWAIRALIVHLVLPFMDSRTQIPIPEAHAEALREAGEALLGDFPSASSGDNDNTSSTSVLGGGDKNTTTNSSSNDFSNSPFTSPTLTPATMTPGPSSSSADSANMIVDPFAEEDDEEDDPFSPNFKNKEGGGGPFSGGSDSKTTLPSFHEDPGEEMRDMVGGGRGRARSVVQHEEMRDVHRGRIVGESTEPPPAWIRHLPAPQLAIAVHKKKTSIMKRRPSTGPLGTATNSFALFSPPQSSASAFHQGSGGTPLGGSTTSNNSPAALPTPMESPRSTDNGSVTATPRGGYYSSSSTAGGGGGHFANLKGSFALPPAAADSGSFHGSQIFTPRSRSDSYSVGGREESRDESSGMLVPRRSVSFRQEDIRDPKKYGAPKRKRSKSLDPQPGPSVAALAVEAAVQRQQVEEEYHRRREQEVLIAQQQQNQGRMRLNTPRLLTSPPASDGPRSASVVTSSYPNSPLGTAETYSSPVMGITSFSSPRPEGDGRMRSNSSNISFNGSSSPSPHLGLLSGSGGRGGGGPSASSAAGRAESGSPGMATPQVGNTPMMSPRNGFGSLTSPGSSSSLPPLPPGLESPPGGSPARGMAGNTPATFVHRSTPTLPDGSRADNYTPPSVFSNSNSKGQFPAQVGSSTIDHPQTTVLSSPSENEFARGSRSPSPIPLQTATRNSFTTSSASKLVPPLGLASVSSTNNNNSGAAGGSSSGGGPTVARAGSFGPMMASFSASSSPMPTPPSSSLSAPPSLPPMPRLPGEGSPSRPVNQVGLMVPPPPRAAISKSASKKLALEDDNL